MKKLFIIILLIISTGAYAQNLQEMELPELDSVKYEHTSIDILDLPTDFSINKINFEPIKLPTFDLKSYLNSRWSYNYNTLKYNYFNPGHSTIGFVNNTPVLQGSYRVNDKVSFKSSTFEINNLFGFPLIGNGLHSNYDVKSIQLDYKVSKNVTISVGGTTVIKNKKFP